MRRRCDSTIAMPQKLRSVQNIKCNKQKENTGFPVISCCSQCVSLDHRGSRENLGPQKMMVDKDSVSKDADFRCRYHCVLSRLEQVLITEDSRFEAKTDEHKWRG